MRLTRTAVVALGWTCLVCLGAAEPKEKKPAPAKGASGPAAGASDEKPFDPYAALKHRFIGPPGNRVSAVVGVPGDPSTYYVGAASGGVWKSVDGGISWFPIFDDQPAQSIG